MDNKAQLQAVREQLSQLDNNNRDHLAEISRLVRLEAELVAQAEFEARVQVQEEKVESISLPYDFNEVFDDPRANEMISELIKEYKRADYAEHNTELTQMVTEHREELRAAADRELQLKRQNDELQAKYEETYAKLGNTSKMFAELETEHNKLRDDYQGVVLEREDALSKRDAAVREKEGIETLLTEKQEHIDKLRDEIAIGAKAAINVMNISPTDRLAALVEQSKSAKIKSSVELALERMDPIRGKIDVVAPPKALEEATFPTQTNDSANIGLDNGQASEIPASDQGVDFPVLPSIETPNITGEVQLAAGAPAAGVQAQITREEFENRIRQVKEEIKAELVTQYGLVKMAS